MLKLRIILLYNWIYYLILLLSVCYVIFVLTLNPYKSLYTLEDKKVEGYINSFRIDGAKVQVELVGKEKVLVNYYATSKKEKEDFLKLELGAYLSVEGEMQRPKNNTLPNLFNYKNYLKSEGINFTFKASSLVKIKKNDKLRYKIKNFIVKEIDKRKSKAYLKTFLLGDKSLLNQSVIESYRNNGISHLFAVSGMHVSLISVLMLSILKKCKLEEIKRYSVVILFLLFYLFLTDYSPSILRATIFFILLAINKIFYFHIKIINIFCLTLSLLLFYNPYFIYNVGFQLSFAASFFLIFFQEDLESKNYFITLLKVSFVSFLGTLPFVINSFFSLNFLSIINNLLFVPLVSFVIFPLSLIVFVLPFLDPILNLVISLFEELSLGIEKIDFLTFSFSKMNLVLCVLYYLMMIICLKFIFKGNSKMFLVLVLFLFIYYHINFLDPNIYYYTLDVGQGDSALIVYKDKGYLIDTGGVLSYKQEQWQMKENEFSLGEDSLVPFFKSIGLKKLEFLVLSHGDFDHMGEAINLVNNFKVEKVIFNCGEYNNLERELIKVLDKKNIKYYSCIQKLNIGNNKLYFLNTKEYDNENDNSNVIYTKLNNYKFLFMGDASSLTEKEILNKYNLSNIDVLKVGHHGSKTSSSKKFIDEINPKYSIISVGKNNRYHHPNKEVLNNLQNTKIYRTDIDGSIILKIKKDKLEIKTCAP